MSKVVERRCGGRPATGSARWNPQDQIWEARITLPGGRRVIRPMRRVPACLSDTPNAPPKKCPCSSCSMAHALAKVTSDKARLEGDVPVEIGETCDEVFRRYNKYQDEVLKQSDAPTKATRWTKWISPRIGLKAPAEVTPDDIEDIRDDLDKAIEAWMLVGGKRAGNKDRAISGGATKNVWTCLISTFKAMCHSKMRDLRVLKDRPNPCVGVEPPGTRGSRKARRKPFVYPRECDAILACKKIPIEWRVLYALAFYLYLRPGELRVLTMADLDVDAGLVHVTKAWDYENEVVKT